MFSETKPSLLKIFFLKSFVLKQNKKTLKMKKAIKASTKSIIGNNVKAHTWWDKIGPYKKQKLETSSQEYDG